MFEFELWAVNKVDGCYAWDSEGKNCLTTIIGNGEIPHADYIHTNKDVKVIESSFDNEHIGNSQAVWEKNIDVIAGCYAFPVWGRHRGILHGAKPKVVHDSSGNRRFHRSVSHTAIRSP